MTHGSEQRQCCVTCGQPRLGPYCHHCSERAVGARELSLACFARDVVHEVTHLDSKIWRTLRLLLSRPGWLTLEYFRGRRTPYIRPIRLYLSLSMLYFVVYSLCDQAALIDVRNVLFVDITGSLAPALDRLRAAQGLAEGPFYEGVNERLSSTVSVFLYFLIFVYALVFKLIYRRRGMYYVQHLIFCLHFMAFSFLRDVLILPLLYWNRAAGFLVGVVTTVLYLYHAICEVYPSSRRKQVLSLFFVYAALGVILVGVTVLSLGIILRSAAV